MILQILLSLCPMREIFTFKSYFRDFYERISDEAKEKIDYALMLLKTQNRVSAKFVKFIEDGIFELRAEYRSIAYRIFFIFDDGNIVILFNGFQKKTQRTPRKDIETAKRIKQEYNESKQRHSEL